MANINDLISKLGVSFNDSARLEQALRHTSYVNENPDALASNERLEFLGDAVLGLVTSEQLYRDLPEATEGEMTKLRAALVNRDTLARLAETIGLDEHLRLGKGEEVSGGRKRPANLAGAMEAVIAAIYLDQGLSTAEEFIQRLLEPELATVLDQGGGKDYKSRLQELLQGQGRPAPIYQLLKTSGPDHDRWFTVEVRSGNSALGSGSGKSKKLAETEAARAALKMLG